MKTVVVKGGVVENVIVAGPDWTPPAGYSRIDVPDDTQVEPGSQVLQDGSFVRPQAPPPSPEPRYVHSKYEFRKRFTLDELVKMDNIERYVTPEQLETYGPLVNTLRRNYEAAQEIDLRNDDVIAGVDLLVQLGVLTTERRAEILDPTR